MQGLTEFLPLIEWPAVISAGLWLEEVLTLFDIILRVGIFAPVIVVTGTVSSDDHRCSVVGAGPGSVKGSTGRAYRHGISDGVYGIGLGDKMESQF